MSAPIISHISDTARWVAVYRAMESERPDAIFTDPYARRLAGPQGDAIVEAMPQGRRMAWPMVVRTAAIDEIILRLLRTDAIDSVVNLAAGLDARPWRLPFPPGFHWTDVDHPAMIDYKTSALAGEQAHCHYRGIGLDLAEAAARRDLLAALAQQGQRTLILTEGLLVYLPEAAVIDLGRDLRAQSTFRYWLTDLASPGLLKMLSGGSGKVVAAGNAPFRFGPADSPRFFAALGWEEMEYRSTFYEGRRLKRSFPGSGFWALMTWLGGPARRTKTERFSGIALHRQAPEGAAPGAR